jgi:hypothetical protein
VPSSVRRRLDTEDGRGAEYRGRAPRLNLAGGRGAECSGTGARSRTCILRASMARRQRRHTTQPRPTASPMTPLRTMMMIRLVLRARRDSQSPDLLRAVRRVLRPVFYPWPQDEDDEAGAGCGTRAARRGAARRGAARRGNGPAARVRPWPSLPSGALLRRRRCLLAARRGLRNSASRASSGDIRRAPDSTWTTIDLAPILRSLASLNRFARRGNHVPRERIGRFDALFRC